MFTPTSALKYLDSFVNYEKIGFSKIDKPFDLEKLKSVLNKMDNPQRAFKTIHIAGTKGKGSVSTFTSSILEEAGFKVGLFTSPHLETPLERIKVNSRSITEESLTKALEHLLKYLGPEANKEFTFFEVYTLMAIVHFYFEKADFAVFEAGMGGRLDATNILTAEACGISPISYDHTQILGEKLEKIAQEKAAIIKRGACCVSAPQKPKALDVLRNRCIKEDASLSLVGEDVTCSITSSTQEGNLFDITTRHAAYKSCRTTLLGGFQAFNAALAVGISEHLLGAEELDEAKLKKGIKKAFIPGRLEVLSKSPLIVIDGAQNADSARSLRKSIEQIFRYDKLILLAGLSKDKDIKGFFSELAPLASEIIITRSLSERAQDPQLIKGHLKGKRAKVTRNAKEALGAALALAGEKDLILIAGSFFLIAEVRRMILGNNTGGTG